MDVLITLVSTEKASKSKGFTQLRQSSSVTYKRKRRSIMKRKPTAEEITTLFNATPEFFSPYLDGKAFQGVRLFYRGENPLRLERRTRNERRI